jgi:hypothetical protein
MNFKFALGSCIVHVDGNPVNLTAGEAWDAADVVVAAHPSMFGDDPPFVRRLNGGLAQYQVVEEASAAPGEKRTTRRAK